MLLSLQTSDSAVLSAVMRRLYIGGLPFASACTDPANVEGSDRPAVAEPGATAAAAGTAGEGAPLPDDERSAAARWAAAISALTCPSVRVTRVDEEPEPPPLTPPVWVLVCVAVWTVSAAGLEACAAANEVASAVVAGGQVGGDAPPAG